jgi:hypothetical protein
MFRALKTLLLWLLIAALPVQGFAAVAKASCGPAHHNAAPVAVMTGEPHHGDDEVHHSHDRGDGSMHAAAEGASSDSSASADKLSGTYKSSYCSACVACCVGAVAPPSALILPAAYSSSETVVVSPLPLVAGYIPDGLKRPPRSISA